jgi:hypothetical protein
MLTLPSALSVMPTVAPLRVAVCWVPVTAVQRDSSVGSK